MQSVIGAHGTVIEPNVGLGITGDNFLEKLISKLRCEGLVRTVRGKADGRTMLREKEHNV